MKLKCGVLGEDGERLAKLNGQRWIRWSTTGEGDDMPLCICINLHTFDTIYKVSTQMNSSITFALRLAGAIFGIVSVLHALRIITCIAITVNGWLVPIWLNWLGLFGAAFLCVWMWRISSNKAGNDYKPYSEKRRY